MYSKLTADQKNKVDIQPVDGGLTFLVTVALLTNVMKNGDLC